MTTTIFNELTQIAIKAANYLNGLCSDSETFQVDGETLSAVISYEAKTGEDRGDYLTAPSWWIDQETVNVEGVYNEDENNDTEAVQWLTKQLN